MGSHTAATVDSDSKQFDVAWLDQHDGVFGFATIFAEVINHKPKPSVGLLT